MAHRSRIGGISIDCKATSPDAGAAFWSAALGAPVEDTSERYHTLTRQSGLHVEVQAVDHDARVHIDIETDDIEAEVARLKGLGARRLRDIRDWVVMEAPTGHRFCVVPAQTDDFDAQAHRWEPS